MKQKRCPHGRMRHMCRECNGVGFCEHDKLSTYCTKCKGGGTCEHGKIRQGCILCKPQSKYRDYRVAAGYRDIPFTLTYDQFVVLVYAPCHFCGVVPACGIDRLDNDHAVGYTPTNSVACCAIDNRMKMSQTESEFLQQIERIYRYRIEEI